MFLLINSWSCVNTNTVSSKSRSLDQMLVIYCQHCRGHIFSLSFLKIAQSFCLEEMLDTFEHCTLLLGIDEMRVRFGAPQAGFKPPVASAADRAKAVIPSFPWLFVCILFTCVIFLLYITVFVYDYVLISLFQILALVGNVFCVRCFSCTIFLTYI